MADAYVVVFAALMLPAGLLGDRFGRRRMLVTGLGIFLRAAVSAGLVVLAFAGLLGSRTTADSGYGFVALWLTITGLGFGLSLIPAMNGGLRALPRDRAGSGAGLLMTLRQ